MVTARLMRTEDAAVIVDMARALASTVGDPMPVLTVDDLVRDALGLDRWFDCFAAELKGALVGYALASKSYEAHTGKKRLWLGESSRAVADAHACVLCNAADAATSSRRSRVGVQQPGIAQGVLQSPL